MRPSLICVAALCVVALFVARPTWAEDKKSDDKKYTIKAPELAKGKSVKVSDKGTTKQSIKAGPVNKSTDIQSVRVYVEKTLEVDEKTKKRTKFSRTYEKAKTIENDESTSKGYHGRTIIAENKEGKWEISAEGKEKLKAEDEQELKTEITLNEEMSSFGYPDKAVEVGAKWSLDSKKLAKLLDFPFVTVDANSVKGEGKLVKVFKKGDKEWGTIEYTINFEAQVLNIKKAKGEIKVTGEQALDGSSGAGKGSAKIKVAGKEEVEFNCMKLTIELNSESNNESESAEVKE